ncbi:GtrA family protein [Paenibacillus tianmuensis]|uniref:GtrA family protein n=1 Tax=Paenibacillus tianmuensis TaxID=624147 RepID=UPI000B83090E|nr:GtrA family protein [Paenibacillus tianmuensis]
MNDTKKQLVRFAVTGFSAVAIDSLSYFVLIQYVNLSISKAVSFIIGTIFAFILNKFWTFEKKALIWSEGIKFFALYSITLTVNVVVNKLFLLLFPGWFILAFLFATGASTVLNFIGQKWWVFKNESKAQRGSSLFQ